MLFKQISATVTTWLEEEQADILTEEVQSKEVPSDSKMKLN